MKRYVALLEFDVASLTAENFTALSEDKSLRIPMSQAMYNYFKNIVENQLSRPDPVAKAVLLDIANHNMTCTMRQLQLLRRVERGENKPNFYSSKN